MAETKPPVILLRIETLGAAITAKTVAINMPRNDEIKFGFPNNPRILPYGLLHERKSPKAITQAQ
jgi:hypothetical protein